MLQSRTFLQLGQYKKCVYMCQFLSVVANEFPSQVILLKCGSVEARFTNIHLSISRYYALFCSYTSTCL